MWFPEELWRIIKNYMLGKEFWIKKMRIKVLTLIPKPTKSFVIYTSATQKIRFLKTVEKIEYFSRSYTIVIYSILDKSIKENSLFHPNI